MKNGSKALKSGVWYTIGTFVVKASSFITTPIFTRLLSVQDVGKFANYSSWLSILMIITTLDLYSALNVARFDFKDDLDSFIASNLLQGSFITVVFFGLIYLGKSTFLRVSSLTDFELLLRFLYCLFCPSLQMYQMKCRIEYKYKISVFLSVLSVLSSTFLSLVLVIILKNRYFGRYVGYMIPYIILNFGIYIFLLKKANSISIKKYWKYAFVIAFPMMWHTLAGNVLTTSDRVMIKSYCGSDAVGLYSIPYSYASMVQILWISMNSAWTPWALERIDEGDYKSVKSATILYTLFFGVIIFVFLLVSPEVLYIMGGKTYISAIGVIPPIMVSYVFNFAYAFYANVEVYYKKQNYIAICTGIAAVVNILLNALLIPRYGYTVAAYTTLVGYIVLLLMHFLCCYFLKKIHLVNNKFIFSFLIAYLGIMLLVQFLYKHVIARYFLIAIILVGSLMGIYIFRREIKQAIKTRSIVPITNRKRGII